MSFFVVSATPCENIENYHKYCDATSDDPFVNLANAEKCALLPHRRVVWVLSYILVEIPICITRGDERARTVFLQFLLSVVIFYFKMSLPEYQPDYRPNHLTLLDPPLSGPDSERPSRVEPVVWTEKAVEDLVKKAIEKTQGEAAAAQRSRMQTAGKGGYKNADTAKLLAEFYPKPSVYARDIPKISNLIRSDSGFKTIFHDMRLDEKVVVNETENMRALSAAIDAAGKKEKKKSSGGCAIS